MYLLPGYIFLIFPSWTISSILANPTGNKKSSFVSTAFINAASPTIISISHQSHGQPIPIKEDLKQLKYHVRTTSSVVIQGIYPSTKLYSKKPAQNAPKPNKIQVKLLKHVAGIGQAGDIIMVAPTFFENKLRKSNSAIRITDEQVAQELQHKADLDKALRESALDMKSKIDDMTLTLSRKAGPEGHLFGGVGNKVLLEELRKGFPAGALDGKQVKIVSIKSAGSDDSDKELGHDIKELGEYRIRIELIKDLSAVFNVSVVPEK